MIRVKPKLPSYCMQVVKLVHNKKIPDLCKLCYPRHKNGCPNYGKKGECPPSAPYIKQILKVDKKMWLVHSEFNLANHVKKMRKKHPEWSEVQLRNLLYWDKTSKRQMKERSKIIQKKLGKRANIAITMGEAHGVNLYVTCKKSGLILEKINMKLKICRHVAILGKAKNLKKLKKLGLNSIIIKEDD